MDIGTSEPGGRNWRDIYRQPNRPAWVGKLIKILIGLIIIVGLVFLGRWINHALKDDTEPVTKPVGTSQTTPQSTARQTQSGTNQGGQTASGTPGSSQPATTGSNQPGQLPDSGPGDAAAIFLATSFAATGLHYILSRRPN